MPILTAEVNESETFCNCIQYSHVITIFPLTRRKIQTFRVVVDNCYIFTHFVKKGIYLAKKCLDFLHNVTELETFLCCLLTPCPSLCLL